MKIAVIGSIVNSHSGARAPIELALAFSTRHMVTFYAYKQDVDFETQKALEKTGVEIVFITKLPSIMRGNFSAFFYCLRELKKRQPDVISAHTTLTLLAAAVVSGIPTVTGYYGTQFGILGERFDKPRTFIRLLDKILDLIIFCKMWLMVHLPREVVAISDFSQRQLVKYYHRSGKRIHLGTTKFPHHNNAKTRPHTDFRLLSVSRITPYKQFEKIIQAVNELNQKHHLVTLTIVGSAPQPKYLTYLKQLASPYIRIRLNVSDRELTRLYQQTDIYVTADRYLYFGMPITEAALFGKSAVAYDFAAAQELIVQGNTGYIAKNDTEFVRYLQKLANDRQLRTRLGKAAQQRTQTMFRWDKTATAHAKEFTKLLHSI